MTTFYFQAMKIRPMSSGCGCIKESQSVAIAVAGINYTKLHPCKLCVPYLLEKSINKDNKYNKKT